MVRLTSWIVLCLCLALLVGCAGQGLRGAPGACAPDPCAPVETACCPAPGEEPPPGDRPPGAQAGEAWCRVWVPPVSEEVERKVLVRPAGKRTVQVPAEYGTRPKLVCVTPAKLSQVEKPAVWAHEKEDVLVRKGSTVYRKVRCGNDPGSECWKLEKCPPKFEERCKPVCVEPPKRCVEYTPAQYKLVDERFLITPASCRTECTPAEYELRRETVCVQPGRWEWRRNDTCDVPTPCAPPPKPEPEQTLPALEVVMVDTNEAGEVEGIFELGEIVRYDVTVRSDVGSEALPPLKVLFLLPEQMEFVSGSGTGIAIAGAGRKATTSLFSIKLEEEARMHVLARVIAVPPTSLVQAVASVRNEANEELARESESTTLTEKGGK